MRKKTKIMVALFSTLAISSAITVPSIVCTLKTNNNEIEASLSTYKDVPSNSNEYYLFNNKAYKTISDATNDFITSNKLISSDLYIGDIADAIFDQETKRVDINKLAKNSTSDFYPAYKNALGQYTHDYNLAKKTFVNPGLITYKYDNLMGTLFNSREEALASMQSSNDGNAVMYYDFNVNGADYKINPLNKDDIKAFQVLAVESLLNSSDLLNYNNRSFNLSIYDNIAQNTYAKLKAGDYKTLIAKIGSQFNELYYKFLDKLKFNVTVRIDNGPDSGGRVKYSFANSDGDAASRKQSLTWYNVNYNELSKFNIFLNRSDFLNFHANSDGELPIQWYSLAYAAEQTDSRTLSAGNSTNTYCVDYWGDDHGGASGTDIQILTKGTNGDINSMLLFDLDIDVTSYDSKTIYNSDDLKNYAKDYFKNGFLSQDFIKQFFETNISYLDKNYLENHSFIYSIVSKIANYISDKNEGNIKIFGKYNCLDYDYDKWNNNYNNNEKKENRIYDNNLGFSINSYEYDKQNFNFDSILKYNNLNTNNAKLSINYNNAPVFFLWYNDKLSNLNTSNQNLQNLSNNGNDWNLKKFIQTFKQEFDSKSDTKSISIQNVSSLYDNIMKIIDLNQNGTNNNIINFDKDLNEFILNNDVISPNFPNTSYDAQHQKLDYKIENALKVYNDEIKKIKDQNSGVIPNLVKNLVRDESDVLVLYNKNYQKQKLNFGKYLGGVSNFNINLLKRNIPIFDNKSDLINAKNAMGSQQPGKVVVVYDLLGNVINPGIELSSDETLSTSDDAIYDAENLILDNIFRTKIVKPDVAKTFCKNPDNTFTLLDNEANLVYFVTLQNKKYAFASHKDAWNYVYEYVLLNSMLVVGGKN